MQYMKVKYSSLLLQCIYSCLYFYPVKPCTKEYCTVTSHRTDIYLISVQGPWVDINREKSKEYNYCLWQKKLWQVNKKWSHCLLFTKKVLNGRVFWVISQLRISQVRTYIRMLFLLLRLVLSFTSTCVVTRISYSSWHITVTYWLIFHIGYWIC